MKIYDPIEIVKEKLFPVIKECLNKNLKSVIIYGSAITDSFDPKISDINVLVLIDRNSSELYIELGKKLKNIIKKYKLSILLLTTEEFINSADVFPMEYYDINDRHLVIYGENIEGKLLLTPHNLRHQLEERLRGFSNQFRQAIIQSGGNYKILKQNINIIPGIIRILMRSVLRLNGISVKDLSDKMIFPEIEKIYEVKFTCLSFLTASSGKSKPQDIASAITGILDILDKIIVKIDDFE